MLLLAQSQWNYAFQKCFLKLSSQAKSNLRQTDFESAASASPFLQHNMRNLKVSIDLSKMPLGLNAPSEIQMLEVIYYLLAPFKHDNSLESTT